MINTDTDRIPVLHSNGNSIEEGNVVPIVKKRGKRKKNFTLNDGENFVQPPRRNPRRQVRRKEGTYYCSKGTDCVFQSEGDEEDEHRNSISKDHKVPLHNAENCSSIANCKEEEITTTPKRKPIIRKRRNISATLSKVSKRLENEVSIESFEDLITDNLNLIKIYIQYLRETYNSDSIKETNSGNENSPISMQANGNDAKCTEIAVNEKNLEIENFTLKHEQNSVSDGLVKHELYISSAKDLLRNQILLYSIVNNVRDVNILLSLLS